MLRVPCELRVARGSLSASGTAQRSGFTLLELLITLSVMAAVAAMALPAMRGPLDKSRLRGAAREVQAALAKSRAMAIREGREVEFLYETDGGHYRIQRVDAVDQSFINVTVMGDAADAGSAAPSGLSAGNRPAQQLDPSSSMSAAADAGGGLTPVGMSAANRGDLEYSGRVLLREGTLPPGIRFRQMDMQGADSPLTGSNQSAALKWSTAIRFLPSGRTQQASLRLVGDREFVVDVQLRGLTGTASYSAPFRVELMHAVDSGVGVLQ